MAAHSFPAIAISDEHAAREASPVRQQSQCWPVISLFTFLACIMAAIGGMAWWDGGLSPEEQSLLGRWVAIDTLSSSTSKGTSSLTCHRELSLLPGHEVQLRIWAQGDPERVEMVPFLGGRGYLHPQEATASASLPAIPHPAALPDSIVSTAAAPVNAAGRWTIKDGRIEIEWNLDNSLVQRIRKKYDEIVLRTQVIYTSRKAGGLVTRDRDDQMTINWFSSPSRATRYTHPPQVWSRQH